MIRPRFQSRPLFRKLIVNPLLDKRKISSFLLKISKKDIVLDYSQLRIGCFHLLLCLLPKGSYVATSCYTIYDMVNVIINAGHVPYFVDIDKNNLGPNIDELIELVKNKKVEAVIYTHLHGYKADLSMLAKYCRTNNCILIEDCAQSLWNTNWNDDLIVPGSFGDAAIYSSGFFKNINTISGGHLVLKLGSFNYEKVINSHKFLKNKITFDFIYRALYAILFKVVTSDLIFNLLLFPLLKFSWKRNFVWINRRAREENSPKYIERDESNIIRMNFIQKFLLNYQNEDSLNQDYYTKAILADIYLFELKNLIDKEIIYIPGVKKIRGDNYSLNGKSSFNQIPILVSERKALLDYLISKGFDISAQHIRNLSETSPYNNFESNETTIAKEVVCQIILLPCYPDYPKKNVLDLCKNINNFYLFKFDNLDKIESN